MRQCVTFSGTLLVLVVMGAGLPAESRAAECSPAEVGYVATFQVKPGSEAAFEQVIARLAAKVVELEPGVLLYAPYKGDQPGTYYMMERYRDEAARQAHAQADEITAIFPELGPLMAGPPDVQPVRAVCP